MKYKTVVVGGTFDTFHKGHESLFQKAFEVSERVIIAITSDAFVSQYKTSAILPYSVRLLGVQQYVTNNHLIDRSHIVPIHTPFAPASPDDPFHLEAIIVSSETEIGARRVNEERKKHGLTVLDIIVISMVQAEDGKSVSSTRIRHGEIDTYGHLILPDHLIPSLRIPLGDIVSDVSKPDGGHIYTVGDMTTATALEKKIIPDISIIDGMDGRLPYTKALEQWQSHEHEVHHVQSGPGFISVKAMEAISGAVTVHTMPQVIIVTGEEDLLALPLILESPLGTQIYYGQPQQGIVRISVTDNKKKEARALLDRFDRFHS